MRNTLHATSSDDEARELVEQGRLTDAMQPIGLGPVPAGSRAGPASRSSRGGERKPAGPSDADRKAAARAAAEARERHARALKAAQAEEAALRREAGAAVRSLERAETALTRAREAFETASGRAKDARRRARTARTALSDAERRVARIERDTPES
jgi:exonuclease VII small subunit